MAYKRRLMSDNTPTDSTRAQSTTLTYTTPVVLCLTAAVYLYAAVLDYTTNNEPGRVWFRIVYIIGAALWLTGQIMVLITTYT
jgi:hypothetical protein